MVADAAVAGADGDVFAGGAGFLDAALPGADAVGLRIERGRGDGERRAEAFADLAVGVGRPWRSLAPRSSAPTQSSCVRTSRRSASGCLIAGDVAIRCLSEDVGSAAEAPLKYGIHGATFRRGQTCQPSTM